MSEPSNLPQELVWQQDGHLSELGLTAMADGEHALLPAEAQVHLEACPACQERLGHAALLAALSARAMELEVARAAAPQAAAERSASDRSLGLAETVGLAPVSSGRGRRPLPRAAIALALLCAAIGAAPSLLSAGSRLPSTVATVVNGAPVVLRMAWQLARGLASSNSPSLVAVPWVAALVLALMGVWVTRRLARATGEVA
jgi:hypothetical protein